MKYKVRFAPGSFDDFDGTQEELDEFVEEINKFIRSEDFINAIETAISLEDFKEVDIEEILTNRTIH